ncbi:MAG: phospholipid carrier-dependent glycosyltransferase [Thermomicrobiales bacterium]
MPGVPSPASPNESLDSGHRTPDQTPRPWPRWIAISALCLAVFFFALWQSSAELHTSPFHPDESRWINRATYLEELRHPLSSFWQDRYLIRAQPPMGSYIIGLGLLLQGKDLHTNGPWDFQYGFENAITWNVTHGNMPSYDNLIAARQWNMVLGALTCVLLVLIVGTMVNWAGGAIAGLMMAIHPLHIYLSTLAVSDAMFTTMFAFAVLSAIWLARKPTWGRSVLLAVALGMGAATKLSPLFIALGWTAYAVVLFLDPWLRSRQRLGRAWGLVSRRERGTERQLGWKLLVQTGLVGSFFVLVYPFLWSDPIGRTRIIFDFRRYEMDNQAGFWPQAAIHGPLDALERTWQNLQDRTSSSERIFVWLGDLFGRDWSGHSIDLYLAAPGLLVLVYLAWKNGLASPQMLGLLAIAAQSVLILFALGVDFNRYYEPLVFTTAAGIGVLGGWLAGLAWGLARSYSRQSTSTNAALPQPVGGGSQSAEWS